ncbi:vesicle transport protein SEC20 [Contarinia nasturtii]|uniref:vesicle transport protein SEC20 n=1 Tax=Contarinia nasturtii TaxID=265458 RepID=UPI0012D3987C|nr:vesicle transport protein SEC20 [Contarinia nasturtii]
MEKEQEILGRLRQDIVDNNLHVKAIIQDITGFRGTIEELNQFNEAGRAKLALLRKSIHRLDDYVADLNNPTLSAEIDSHRQQFSRTLQAFRRANITTMLEIEKLDKAELLSNKTEVRHRTVGQSKHAQSSLAYQQDSVTEKMLSISRHLSETTQKSAATLETLVASSANVEGTNDELHNTAGTILHSKKLLKKYGRRECTDKILVFFAFTLFIVVVLYIVQKRLF